MNFYLMRHGQTDWNIEKLAQGRTDISLNDTGRQQAREARKAIDELDFDVCVCSPLSRARETAQIVAGDRGDIIVNDLLTECRFGDLEGHPLELDFFENYWRFDSVYNEHNVESFHDLMQRASDFVAWAQASDYENLLVVSHGAFLRALHFTLIGYDESTKFDTVRIHNCEIRQYAL